MDMGGPQTGVDVQASADERMQEGSRPLIMQGSAKHLSMQPPASDAGVNVQAATNGQNMISLDGSKTLYELGFNRPAPRTHDRTHACTRMRTLTCVPARTHAGMHASMHATLTATHHRVPWASHCCSILCSSR